MIYYDKEKYEFVDELKTDKILLLKDNKTDKKVIAKGVEKKEYENYLKLKSLTNIPKVIDFDNNTLYLEYIDCLNLNQYLDLNPKLNLEIFYKFALELLDTIESFHSNMMIHKDITASNILYDDILNKVYLLDFEYSSTIKHKYDNNININEIRGNVNYISPEQTGRINRNTDFRSDFYSIGVIFYKFITKRLPFNDVDISTAIYELISKKPLSPKLINNAIPEMLSKIILKLLAKEPENRYQSIYGIKYDILQLSNNSDFDLASKDYSNKLDIKHNHYGREEHIKRLHKIFDSVINNENQLVTIGGFSGVGKTSLVYELHKVLNKNFGFYGESKFDQLSQSSPYFGFIKILDDFFDFILKQDDESVEKVRIDVLDALDGEGLVFTSRIPNLELLIGVQPVLETVSAKEEEKRFHRIFLNLIKAISDANRPIIIFIDDLQWADIGTIDLIEKIVLDKSVQNILIINAYRDNEVDKNHLYIKMLNKIKEQKNIVEMILYNLTYENLSLLIEETIYTNNEQLIKLIYEKSSGNAFFVNQIINLFNEEMLFNFNPETLAFEYDMNQLYNLGLTDDVIEIATKNINSLDNHTINILKIASVVGHTFTINILNRIIPKVDNIDVLLIPALEKGFVILNNGLYKFGHDRIQQAFYQLNNQNDIPNIHLNIAINFDKYQDEITIFSNIKIDITNHYNKAISILDTIQTKRAIELNLDVAEQSKKALVYKEALVYIDTGLNLLNKEDKDIYWDYLYLKIGIFYNMGDLESMQKVEPLLESLVDGDEKLANLANFVIIRKFLQNDHLEVLKYGQKVLVKLGMVAPPLKANKLTVMKQFAIFLFNLKGRSLDDLEFSKEITNKRKYYCSQVLFDLIPSSFMLSADMFGTYSLIMGNIAVKYGNSKFASFGYTMTAILFSGGFKMFEKANRLGEVALRVGEKYYDLDSYSRVNTLFGCFLVHNTRPYKDHITYRELSNKGLVLVGNTMFRNYNDFITRVPDALYDNTNLEIIKTKNKDILIMYIRSKEVDLVKFQEYFFSFIGRLQGDDPLDIEKNYGYNEIEYMKYFESIQNTTVKSMVYTFKALELYIFEQYDDTWHYIKIASRYIQDQFGLMTDHLFRLLFNLCYLEVSDRKSLLEIGFYKLNMFLLKRYAKSAPFNFNIYLNIALAKQEMKNSNTQKAMKLFEYALNDADSAFHKAFIYDIIGKCWIESNQELGKLYLTKALKYYDEYKAYGKVKFLEDRYNVTLEFDKSIELDKGNSSYTRENLNHQTVIKAIQTITQETTTDSILYKMGNILVENSGATKSYIVLKSKDSYNIRSYYDNQNISLLTKDYKSEKNIAHTVLNYLFKTQHTIIVDDASTSKDFNDPYLQEHNIKSLLVIPMVQNNEIKGLLYCENNLISNAFTSNIVETLTLILTQLVISIENSSMYEVLEDKVAQRTKQLELEKYKAQEATKSKSDFLANMSHEIRTPMNGIIGMTHLALDTTLNKKQKHYLNTIDSSANSLLCIINDILDFSKIEAGKLKLDKIDFHLKELIVNITNLVGFQAYEKGLDFDIKYDEDIHLNLHGDSLRISQILINLINNAIKFTNKGYVEVKISSVNSKFKFVVKDSGIGMNSKAQDKLFKAFSQADKSTTRKFGGTGLGLSITKQLVELMGGNIWVTSKENQGSIFGFEIDLEDAKDEITLDLKNQITLDDIKGLETSHILLVEDNNINQEIIIGLLENSGINIDIASNGKEAIELYTNKSYDLILMDLQMPVMDGYEATKIIRETDKVIPIIALTANAMVQDIEQTKLIGMNEHLNKPIDVEKLYATLVKYISISKDSIITTKQISPEQIKLPTFKIIDSEIGLSYVSQNRKLYLKILNNFKNDYEDIKLELLNDEEFKREIHTLKGLSINIGAIALNEIVQEIDLSQNKGLLDNFYIELNKVLEELSMLLKDDVEVKGLVPLTKELKDEFLEQIKTYSAKRNAKGCSEVLNNIYNYQLIHIDKIYFETISELIKNRKYKKILEVI